MELNFFLEVVAVISALIYVILASRANRICFLFGFISSLIYIYLATILKFYFDTFINTYYLIMSVYGWIYWGKKKEEKTVISIMPRSRFVLLVLLGLILTIVAAFTVDRYADASLPYLDAFTTIFSIIATWMVVKMYLRNWLIWIVVDLVATGMYFYKELHLTSFLFLLYTFIAIYGFFQWKQKLSNA